MSDSQKIRRLDQRPLQEALSTRLHSFIPGVTMDELIKYFFALNAFIAIAVLVLIMFSLFRESISLNPARGFFGQNTLNLKVYREAGLEYVDLLKQETSGLDDLDKYLAKLRLSEFKTLVFQAESAGKSEDDALAEANTALTDFDAYAGQFSGLGDELNTIVGTLGETVTATKESVKVMEDKKVEKDLYLSKHRQDLADAVVIKEIDLEAAVKPLKDALPQIQAANLKLTEALKALVAAPVVLTNQDLAQKIETHFKPKVNAFLSEPAKIEGKLQAWDPNLPIAWYRPYTEFFFGSEWQTASFWQDYYGIIPLLVGSMWISVVALLIAVPLGVGAGVYVNQISSPWEQHFIKPAIEFISAIPSVVLGFFGVAILGETIRWFSDPSTHQVLDQGVFMNGFWNDLGTFLQPLSNLGIYFHIFPISERLNIITAGILLGLMAVPTIFTLTEDAINNVPRSFKEASFALGANRLQTIWRIILPASLSGVISAILLGFGRVIGETMVVLLCAGNRIQIPPLSDGLGILFQPVHTMTGIIAQELGEVENGSIHWHALFMVGLVLFVISLAINYAAQQIVKKFKISIG